MSVGPNISKWILPLSRRTEEQRSYDLQSGWSGRKILRFVCVLGMAAACWLAIGLVAFEVVHLAQN